MWGRGQVSQSTVGQGSRLAFYFKYDGTLLKGSKLWSDHLIYSYQCHPSYRMEIKFKKERGKKNTAKRCQKQTPQESWGWKRLCALDYSCGKDTNRSGNI